MIVAVTVTDILLVALIAIILLAGLIEIVGSIIRGIINHYKVKKYNKKKGD